MTRPSYVLAIVALALATRVAAAEPSTRVVLADPDPELQSALEQTLAPWHFEVLVDRDAPASVAEAEQRARTRGARFVVWRRDGDLVVFDRDRGSAEHRDGVRGALDGPGAASAALTVKTLMRLPPPGEPMAIGPTPPGIVTVPPPRELRVHASVASRMVRGDNTAFGARFEAAVFLRPWGTRRIRFGLGAELGTGNGIANNGFKGSWNDSALFAIVGWGVDRGAWQVEPHVAIGATRSKLSGTQSGENRTEVDVLAILRAGLWVRHRIGSFSAGGGLDLLLTPSTPTYTRDGMGMGMGSSDIFRVPDVGVVLGVVGAFDLDL